MTLKKPSRAGLTALVLGVLLGLFLSVSVISTSHAQTPAPAAAPAAAAPAPRSGSAAAGLRCDGQAADPERL